MTESNPQCLLCNVVCFGGGRHLGFTITLGAKYEQVRVWSQVCDCCAASIAEDWSAIVRNKFARKRRWLEQAPQKKVGNG